MNAKKILLVEDEEVLRDLVSEKLTGEGFFVMEAKNGEEGFEKALTELPDLIFLDLLMPKSNGVSMIKQLQQSQKTKDIPIVILTNMSNPKEILDSEEEDVFFSKFLSSPKVSFQNQYHIVIKSNVQLRHLVDKTRQILQV